ncbi:Outward-rectifier potassium channel TOK1 [Grifola frondosa]|uniref:Outward-rectifier potassium channel TOK1 n=1 Tax=Grifola frondosa TaxID=5627 RepID=A0A1C7MLE9_GRIFR|nr:Outward-rectifier potassium channel TOK1 [Grifola frondosa]
MGLGAFINTILAFQWRRKQNTDIEKASREYDHHSNAQEDLDHHDDDDHHAEHDLDGTEDVLSTNTPHRIRHIYSKISKTTFSDRNDDSSYSSTPHVPLLSRIKSLIFPSDEVTDIDRSISNYRWTPIISGIVIPFSILLEIPGLTERWYIRTENNQTVQTRPNPPLLDVGLGISLGFALLANVCLIMRFLEKRVMTVTILCIVSLTTHDIINVIALTVFGVQHRFNDGFTYGTAFWMTLCSTITSSFANITIIIDLIRTPDFAQRGSGLTRKQRALMIIVIVLLLYLAFGAMVNSFMLDLSFINGLYFAVVSIETIGFGDIVPDSTGSRIFTCFYIAFGVINIGVAIAMCRETIMEGLELGYRKRGSPVWVSADSDNENEGVRFLGLDMRLPAVFPLLKRVSNVVKPHPPAGSTRPAPNVRGHPRGMRLNVDALSTASLETAALEAGVPLEMFLDLGERRGVRDGNKEGSPPARGEPAAGPNVDGVGVAPTIGARNLAYAFHGTMSRGWPSHPQTPTHAQLGRMAAMLTKFAVAATGRHAQGPIAPSHSAGHHPSRRHSQPGHEDRAQTPEHVQEASDEGHGRRKDTVPPLLDANKRAAPKWWRDFARGSNRRSGWVYEKIKEDMVAEEKRAYYFKLSVAWALFFMFWTVGSGIFCATEGWSYATAIYFCFIAFTTTGYGDLTPQTPAGRAIFVVWALFGVGTLTILVSVLQEAGSSRYKRALHSEVFDNAVKKYRKRQAQEAAKARPRSHLQDLRSSAAPKSAPGPHGAPNADGSQRHDLSALYPAIRATKARVEESRGLAQRALETLPDEIISNAKVFHDYIQYFAGEVANKLPDMELADERRSADVPEELRKLLDDIAKMEGISERVKGEIFQDTDARNTLFMLNIERALKRMVTSAERALAALADRDALIAMNEEQALLRQSGQTSSAELDACSDEGRSSHSEQVTDQGTSRSPDLSGVSSLFDVTHKTTPAVSSHSSIHSRQNAAGFADE